MVDWVKDALAEVAEQKAAEKEKETAEVVPLRTPQPYKGKARIIVPGAKPFKFVAVGDLEITEPDYVVDEFLETETLGVVFGEPGAAKSFLVQDLSCCIASGRDFHGREVRQGSVFYIAGEGHGGLARRFEAWARHNGTSREGLPLFTSERAANFLDTSHAAEVTSAINELSAEHGTPRLIVIDTLARNFGDGDENTTKDMNAFVNAVAGLKDQYPGCTILIVHHTGLADKNRSRGNSALKGSLDAEYRVEKLNGGKANVVNTKMKEGPDGWEVPFEKKFVPLGIDRKRREFGSLVLVPSDAPASATGKRLTPAQQLAVDTFKEAARDKGVRDNGAFRGVYLEDWREYFYRKHTGDTSDAKKKAFQRARDNRNLFDVNDDLYLLKSNGVEDLL